jgi:Uma2 family endonuclease
MVQRLPEPYRIDPLDPRAPSQEVWDAMTPEQRARVVAMLPAEVPWELHPPEGDQHRKAKTRTADTLDAFFRRIGRKIYVSSELGVFYPEERRFAPDVLAVLDVDPHDRTKWVVADEGKGLDLVIEVHFHGDAAKDYAVNVERYAHLGITEYFIFDRARLSLRGYRLPRSDEDRGTRARVYRPILPQQGRYTSEVLGLDLMVEEEKLRFLIGMAEVPEAEELVVKLGSMLDRVLLHKEEAEERAQVEAARAQLEAERAQAEAVRAQLEAARAQVEAARATALQQELAEVKQKLTAAEALIADLKRGR